MIPSSAVYMFCIDISLCIFHLTFLQPLSAASEHLGQGRAVGTIQSWEHVVRAPREHSRGQLTVGLGRQKLIKVAPGGSQLADEEQVSCGEVPTQSHDCHCHTVQVFCLCEQCLLAFVSENDRSKCPKIGTCLSVHHPAQLSGSVQLLCFPCPAVPLLEGGSGDKPAWCSQQPCDTALLSAVFRTLSGDVENPALRNQQGF